MEKLVEASTAEAEAVSAVWQAAKAASVDSVEEEGSDGRSSGAHASDKLQVSETSSDGSETDTLEPDVRLHPRAVCCLYLLRLEELTNIFYFISKLFDKAYYRSNCKFLQC